MNRHRPRHLSPKHGSRWSPLSPGLSLPQALVGAGQQPPPLGDLKQAIKTQIWSKAICVAGLSLIVFSLFLPWYKAAASSQMQGSGMQEGANFSASIIGLLTLPGILVFLLVIVAGILSFWPPYRWARVAVAGICLLMFLCIIWGFFYGPDLNASASASAGGYGASASAKAGPSWGQWITLLGDLTLAISAVLIFFGIGKPNH